MESSPLSPLSSIVSSKSDAEEEVETRGRVCRASREMDDVEPGSRLSDDDGDSSEEKLC